MEFSTEDHFEFIIGLTDSEQIRVKVYRPQPGGKPIPLNAVERKVKPDDITIRN